MSIPKPSAEAKAAFQRLVPQDRAVTTRPMFGNLAAFVNGNMFCGLFGEDLFVRVSDDDQVKLRKQGGRAFEPMPGRAMTGYLLVPPGWQKNPDATGAWIMTALSWSQGLPAKAAKTARSPKAASSKTAARRTR